MAYKCEICGRGPQTGHVVSHSNIKTKTRFMINLKQVRTKSQGTVRKKRVCTKCLRSNAIQKA